MVFRLGCRLASTLRRTSCPYPRWTVFPAQARTNWSRESGLGPALPPLPRQARADRGSERRRIGPLEQASPPQRRSMRWDDKFLVACSFRAVPILLNASHRPGIRQTAGTRNTLAAQRWPAVRVRGVTRPPFRNGRCVGGGGGGGTISTGPRTERGWLQALG